MTCKFCGQETYRRIIYCDIRCKEGWTNSMRTLAKQEGLPVRCRQCGVVYQRFTARFKSLCPTCTRQNWEAIPVYLTIEWRREVKRLISTGKVTMQQISAYLQNHLMRYLRSVR